MQYHCLFPVLSFSKYLKKVKKELNYLRIFD